jgi:subtilase family serine protease
MGPVTVLAAVAAAAGLVMSAGPAAAAPAQPAASAAAHARSAAASPAASAPARTAQPKVTRHPTLRVCPTSVKAGHATCLSVRRTDVAAHKGLFAAGAIPGGYGPSDLQSAYNLQSSNGSGATVAIVDAFDDPNAEADLQVYRAQYGLPVCDTANGCFRKVAQDGSTNYPATDPGWSEEISLDVDMVSAICPNCHILLVESNDNSLANLGAAVNEAVTLGAKYVSNSYGGPEDPSELTADSQFYNHPGVAVTASLGDGGYGAIYPAASQDVTAVGGTTLTRDSTAARGWTETAWSGAGSGCSAYEAKPSWQSDTGCSNRTVADVSAVADPNTGVSVYDTVPANGLGAGWNVFGGTSVASPIIASTYALAGTPVSGTHPSSYPYAATSALNDVTSGSNGSCSPSYLCTAGPGYDGPTGLGTPDGGSAFTTAKGYTPVTPVRILDTRYGTGGYKGLVGAGKTISVQVAGKNGVPSGVSAVVLNVTATNPTASSFVTVYPDGQSRPVVSNLNFIKGETIPNLVIVPVGSDGKVDFYNASGSVSLLADLAGYFMG